GTRVAVSSEQDWLEHAGTLAGRELKVAKRIRCRPVTAAGVVTRHGTLVGPVLSEANGDGSGLETSVLPEEQRRSARRVMQRVGDLLGREGYRGWLELEVLAEADGDVAHVGRLQLRLTSASAPANVTAVARGDLPLFLFHLLEFLDVDYELDVEGL